MNKKLLLISNVLAMAILFVYIMLLQRYFSSILRKLYQSISETMISSPDAFSVGVIGGEDGPTSIFISSPKGDNPLFCLLIPLVIVVIVLISNVVFFYRYRH